MYKTSEETQIRKDAKRQHILDIAASVFANRGYHNTAVKDIVAAAGISVGSFYFYFKGKEQLFTELFVTVNESFRQMADRVVDPLNYSLAKNFARVIAANLWMYQQNRELAKLMLIDVVGVNPEFDKIRSESLRKTCDDMVERFTQFSERGIIQVPNVKVAALAFESSFHYLVIDWLESDGTVKLTDSAYGLAIYNLQAIRAAFSEEDVALWVGEILEELNQQPDE